MSEYGEIISATFGTNRRRAAGQAAGASLENDPEQATKALQLGQATGVPPEVIHGDVDYFDSSLKSRLSSNIIEGNTALQRYVNRNPLAAQLSGDDWGSLDETTRSLQAHDFNIPWYRIVAHNLHRGIGQGLGMAAEGIGYLAGIEGTKGAAERISTASKAATLAPQEARIGPWKVGGGQGASEEEAQALAASEESITGMVAQGAGNLLVAAPAAAVGATFGTEAALSALLLQMGISGAAGEKAKAEQKGATEDEIASAFTVGFASNVALNAVPFHLLMRPAQALTAGLPGWTVAKLMQAVQSGVVFSAANELQEVINTFAAQQIYDKNATYSFENNRAISQFILGGLLGGGFAKVKPYVDAGKEPPMGLDPTYDNLNIRISKQDVNSLYDSLALAQKNSTRERSPEYAANAYREAYGDGSIGISSEAIRKVYGEEQPSLEDGKLGWVPNLADQMKAAELTGGDVKVPVADFLARIDPELAKELKDFVRVRENGITNAEAKERSKVTYQAQNIEAFHGSPHEFDAFSMEKIGTGEGAQSYGHGLYFAENPEVAKSYADTLQDQALRLHDANLIRNLLAKGMSDAEIIARLEKNGNFYAAQELAAYKKNAKGGLYRVRIRANKEDFLDWDKPLKEQSPSVQKAVRAFIEDSIARQQKARDEALARGGYSTGRKFSSRELERLQTPLQAADDMPGAEIYKRFGLPAMNAQEGSEKSSKALREAGIPGIKYLDQGSRPNNKHAKRLEDISSEIDKLKSKGAENLTTEEMSKFEALEGEREKLKRDMEGTHNFVLFDESLIDILDRNGQALRSAEEAAGFKNLEQVWAEAEAAGAKWTRVGEAEVLEGPLTTEQITLAAAIKGFVKQVAPDMGEVKAVHGIRKVSGEDGITHGLYTEFTDQLPIIHWVVGTEDAYGVARHEVGHFLRRSGLLKESEWFTLTRAAREKGWLTKHNIERDYAGLQMPQKLEEAVMREFEEFGRSPESMAEGPIKEIFKKILEIKEGLKRAIKEALGKELTADDIFRMMESGEVGRRSMRPRDPRAFQPTQAEARGIMQPELPGTRRLEDTPIARGAAFGMTQKRYENYIKMATRQWEGKQEWLRKKAEEAERKRQTKEWKENYKAEEEAVRQDFEKLPQVALGLLFREGELYGEKFEFRPKLDKKSLTEEEIKALPRNIVGVGGISPEDVAGLFGLPSGKDVIQILTKLEQDRGKVPMRDYLNRIIEFETDQRMELKYGDLEKNIEEADDLIHNDGQLALLHEETVGLASKAGLEFTFTKDQIVDAVKSTFGKLRHIDISSRQFLRDIKKASDALQDAFLKGDFTEAFKQKQRQFLAETMYQEAKDYEKASKQFAAKASRLGRENLVLPREFMDYGQQILQSVDLPINRTPEQLAESIGRGAYQTLPEFVRGHHGDGWELFVDNETITGARRKFDDLSVDQFYDLKSSIDSMINIGRKVQKEITQGKVREFHETRAEILENIRTMPERPVDHNTNWFYAMDAALTKMEEIVKDLDLRKELGPLYNKLIVPMQHAKHTEYTYQEKLVQQLRALTDGFQGDWRKTLEDKIDNDFLIDPNTGQFFDMSRQHMINIMMHWGNESNIKAFTEGYAGKEYKDNAPVIRQKLEQMFDKYATKEDWDYVKRMGDIFGQWREPAAQLYYELSGTESVKWIAPREVVTKHGTYSGWYFPIIKDKSRLSSIQKEAEPPDTDLMGINYYRATTANAYIQTRTGDVHPIQFMAPMELVAARMQQTIHDISFRRAVMEANQIIHDKQIMHAIERHYGKEYAKHFKPWIDDIANHYNINEVGLSWVYNAMRRMRLNLMNNALGFNLNVILSADVGAPSAASLAAMYDRKGSYDLALSKSYELTHTFRNMNRDYREALELSFRKGNFDNFTQEASRWAFAPAVWASQQFRVATWVAKYNEGLGKGLSEGEASAIADSAVRERHGAGGIPDLPAIMRGGEGAKLITLFYGFFNTMYNWQRQIPGQLRRGEYKQAWTALYGSVLISSAFGAALFNERKEKDSWFKIIGTAIPLQLLSTIPFAREAGNYFLQGYLPSTPWGSMLKAVGATGKDIYDYYNKGKAPKKAIQHGLNTLGLLANLPLGQIGRTAQFHYDIATARQRPRDIWEYLRGFRTGEARLRKK